MPCPKYVPGVAELMNDVLGRLPLLAAARLRPLPRGAPEHAAAAAAGGATRAPWWCRARTRRATCPPSRTASRAWAPSRRSSSSTTRATTPPPRACATRSPLIPTVASSSSTGPGRGKGAAVRAGLAEASGDVLMILDADMTVMPEDLPAFFEAITENKGELVNGTRLVYPLGGRSDAHRQHPRQQALRLGVQLPARAAHHRYACAARRW